MRQALIQQRNHTRAAKYKSKGTPASYQTTYAPSIRHWLLASSRQNTQKLLVHPKLQPFHVYTVHQVLCTASGQFR